MTFETQILVAIQQVVLSSHWTIALAVFFARWLIFANVVLIVGLLVARHKRARHGAVEAGWATLVALALTAGIAHFVERLRPFLASHDVIRLIPPPFNTSFPSGHTATAFAIAFALWHADRRVGAVSFAIATVVAFGRMAVGVHYPTDILGGFVLGALSFWLVRWGHHQLTRRDIARSASHHHHT